MAPEPAPEVAKAPVGEIVEGADAHMALAKGIATGDEAAAVAGANQLLDYLERFARRVIDR
ncbi:MAG: transcriptional regulator, GntR family [Variovorax sp.]|nr:transcriptional regulator, GntR family [Variovorax sp.]